MVDEPPPLRQLVPAQLAHELEAPVHGGEDGEVLLRDAFPQVFDYRIVVGVARPHGFMIGRHEPTVHESTI